MSKEDVPGTGFITDGTDAHEILAKFATTQFLVNELLPPGEGYNDSGGSEPNNPMIVMKYPDPPAS